MTALSKSRYTSFSIARSCFNSSIDAYAMVMVYIFAKGVISRAQKTIRIEII